MPEKKNILVTGANGQLGMEFRVLSEKYAGFNFSFVSRDELAIENFIAVENYFQLQSFDYCINCAAYTAVDKAETEKEKAFLINADAVGNLAAVCKKYQTQLVHFSTDYVFDGTATVPYKEDAVTMPSGVYAASKLKGEELAMQNNAETIIIRTSWVYSSFGTNFVKTMLRLMKERNSINVVDDQLGCPTYAADLAETVMFIIDKCAITNNQNSIFNYCNAGITSWYEFASEIKRLTGSSCIISPIPTTSYSTPAKRPQYSVLDTNKIQEMFGIVIPDWKVSLEKCLSLLHQAPR